MLPTIALLSCISKMHDYRNQIHANTYSITQYYLNTFTIEKRNSKIKMNKVCT